MVNQNELLPIIILFLFVVGIGVFFLKNHILAWRITIITVLLQCVSTLFLWFFFKSGNTEVLLPFFGGLGIEFQLNEFSLLLTTLASVLWLVSIIESKEYFKNNKKYLCSYYGAVLLTFSGTLGVFFAGNLLTLFIFFEIMSFSSYLWIIHNRDRVSVEAGKNYLWYTVIGGLSF